MDPSLEIRKLPINIKSELCQLLEIQEGWKKLMAIIPQTLFLDDYECDISLHNPPKYRSEHFYIIEDVSLKKRLFCSEILFREWGTSGRVRPALGHLKYLLQKAELFRAADYVTVDILKQEPVSRPGKGPAAPVIFNSDELEDSETKKIEKLLDEINYPSSAIANINKLNFLNTNLNYSGKEPPKVIPKIVISESPDVEESKPAFNVPIVVQMEKTRSESDLIQFSHDSISNSDNNANVPNLTSLLSEEEPSGSSESINIPAVVENLSLSSSNIPAVIHSTYSETSSESSSGNIPAILDSFSGVSSNNIPTNPQNVSIINRPNLSCLLSNSEANFNVPALSGLSLSSNSDSSSNFPALSQLLNDNSNSNMKNSRSCSSPLPNLSLNTLLPHFSYNELDIATKNFDETPVKQGGRFLGSGAFGKVYLAEGLFGKPQLVAVKKMLLDSSKEVQVDDLATKQFVNEVEILSKYKHENLVSLLGYSCDGLTYCLLYEYVPGGALKERLQKHELIWTERFYIALGTARAIAYLHTGYSTPLIHRDVKSANILLDYTNKPKLCDFGLIKRSMTQNTYTATTIFGTSAYMAPEAFRGDISVKLDVFSFGVVLLELLTSLPPMDEGREGVDLVTHVQDKCQNVIAPLLDTLAGSWCANDINFGEKLYETAQNCLNEKKYRPTMSTVYNTLGELLKKSL